MSVELPIVATVEDAHRHAVDDFNRWRGHCVECLARLEQAAAQTVAVLPRPVGGRQPMTFGDRVKALKAVLADSHDKSAGRILADLAALHDDLDWRNRIVHATGRIYLDRDGGWAWHYTFQPSKVGAAPESGILDRHEGTALEKRLSGQVRSLCDRLCNLRGAKTADTSANG